VSNLKAAKAIILKKTKYRESDLIVQMILSTGAKLSALARGALKSKKRFSGGVLEPTQYVQVQYRERTEGQMVVLEEASMIDGFEQLRTDYDRMNLALYLVSSVNIVSQEGDAQSAALFNLLGHSLRSLQTIQNIELFRSVFQVKLLYQQGVLEQEDWMAAVLATNIKDFSEFESVFKLKNAQSEWIERLAGQYLSTASTQKAPL